MLRRLNFARGMITFLALVSSSLAESIDFVLADNSSLASGEQFFRRGDNSSDDWVCGYDVNKNNAPYGCELGDTCVNITNITPANISVYPPHYVACCHPYSFLSPQEQQLTALVASGWCNIFYPTPSSAYEVGFFTSCYKPTVETSIFTNYFTYTTPYESTTVYTLTRLYGACSDTQYPHCYGYTFSEAGPDYGLWACGTVDSTATLVAKSGLPLYTSSSTSDSYTTPKTTTTTVQIPNTGIPIVIVTPGMPRTAAQTAGPTATTTNVGINRTPILGAIPLVLYLACWLVVHLA